MNKPFEFDLTLVEYLTALIQLAKNKNIVTMSRKVTESRFGNDTEIIIELRFVKFDTDRL